MRVERELKEFIRNIDREYSLKKISPVLFKSIGEFISRKGKRVRPTLLVIAYMGFAKKIAPGLYKSAISLELLHDFMLVHDDVIDKSETRRGKPSMHAMLNNYLSKGRGIKFDGEGLTIVAGDVLFAMALRAFLSIKEEPRRKEAALIRLIDAAMYTGSGEFIELLSGLKAIDKITKQDIYKIYDYKTANYTFAYPLAIGATLAGAKKAEVDRLLRYGIYLGRSFQIKDDILGMFSEETAIGKSTLTDLQEAKKTILIWKAYNNLPAAGKLAVKNLLSKKRVGKMDLLKIRRLVNESGALEFARREIGDYIDKAQIVIRDSGMKPRYKKMLLKYCLGILNL